MAIGHSHLIWVNPPNKGLRHSLRMQIWDRDGPLCGYCAALLTIKTFTVDHKLARANGGTDDPENLTIACRPCNSSKGAN